MEKPIYLKKVIIEGFRSFGKKTEINIDDFNTFIGNNGTGKTTTLQALNKIFSTNPKDRIIEATDFFVSPQEENEQTTSRNLSIDVIFGISTKKLENDGRAAAFFLKNMTINSPEGEPYLHIRLEASWTSEGGASGTVDYNTYYVDRENNLTIASRLQLNSLRMIYVPAVRNPTRILKDSSHSLLSSLIKNVVWAEQTKEKINNENKRLNTDFLSERGMALINDKVHKIWDEFCPDERYGGAKLEISPTDLVAMSKQTQIVFNSSNIEHNYQIDEMGDGSRSLFYISTVKTALEIENELIGLEAENDPIINDTPPLLTMVAIEEPENHISPHLLGKLMNRLLEIAKLKNAQVLLTSHSPAIVKRVDPLKIRHFRIKSREKYTEVHKLSLPNKEDEAYKYIKRAVQTYPELYFAQLVILGEGDSEEIILPRFFEAKNKNLDEAGISVVPLGGRFVNHLWRLLNQLGIPYITLLDLDKERKGGDWQRIKYVIKELKKLKENDEELNEKLSVFEGQKVVSSEKDLKEAIDALENKNIFFSAPLDIDFMMLKAYGGFYKGLLNDDEGPRYKNKQGKNVKVPKKNTKSLEEDFVKKIEDAVAETLKKDGGTGESYNQEERELMIWYNYFFLGRGKPSTHILALSSIDDETLNTNMPKVIERLLVKAEYLLEGENEK
ncbi:AAA family ATPase [Pediococcus acidilactici]|uniref:ATP-dependent nuclease n=1 Tax=Pediococcus acidilactici TaxID=1254 RepID=UPI001324C0F7|nr:AAA family ATPase [Pediococcus acidilactici]KAF0362132.1 AAA family ATPase [Pediococcus acidilactici]KAF0365852.1 AAA family ATPase [Pediococcus acidilactici]KAF0416740.1 AAA family ATPase [Pediococcus acidilactici]KAF0420422.1 AAA family ATPase [Pediococcus acidilactici]KAF0472462.1 AAA family ATPase [Pediococcus acidilactici]